MGKNAPIGLYGWVQSNDGRSAGLFIGFLAAVQAMAALALFLPLTFVDPEHAPLLGWNGYFLRYAPVVLVTSIGWFGWQMFWHIESVKRAVGFRFVDAIDEPRLCRLIEPLITAMGLPAPFVGVIESDARNAFACGIARKKAVVVVTRGLIDDLTDVELACVLGHELAHIRNGDIRLMAAANIFMDALGKLHRNNPLKFTIVHVVLAIVIPVILPLTLAGGFIGHLALRAGQVSRLKIASAREFIADAQAVQLTQNPAAMASALVKVEQHWEVKGARRSDDAMMIAGDTLGENATHPTVPQRIAALARVTGSMVFNAPDALPKEAWDSSRSLTEAKAAALLQKLPAARVLSRVRAGAAENVLGLTFNGMVMAGMAIVGLVTLHWSEIANPRTMLAKFDIRPLSLMVGSPMACMVEVAVTGDEACKHRWQSRTYRDFEGQKNTLAGWLADGSAKRRAKGFLKPDIGVSSMDGLSLRREEYRGQSGKLRGTTAVMDGQGAFQAENGSGFTNKVPTDLMVAELDQVGCFFAAMNYGEPEGHYAPSYSINGTNLEGFMQAAQDSANVPSELSDASLHSYLDTRGTLTQISYDFYGLKGLRYMQAAYRDPVHTPMIARMSERLGDPAFKRGMDALNVAKARALVRNPDRFVPCPAVRRGY